jgi:septum formation protein
MPAQRTKFILASASPRRVEIFRTLGLDFESLASEVSEEVQNGEPPSDYVLRVARAKAAAVSSKFSSGLIVGADTIVVVDGHTLGKPTTDAEAAEMLKLLSGRWHAVMTGLAIRDASSDREVAEYCKTLVRFCDLSDGEIADYVATGEPLDKAGGYAIQGRGMLFIEEIAGNYQGTPRHRTSRSRNPVAPHRGATGFRLIIENQISRDPPP